MKVTPTDKFIQSYKTGSVIDQTPANVSNALGFAPNQITPDDPSGDDKVTMKWGGTVKVAGKVVEIAIWDYKGSGRDGVFSTYGPDDVFTKLFGANYKTGY